MKKDESQKDAITHARQYAQIQAIEKGYAYYNVHNRDDPDGFNDLWQMGRPSPNTSNVKTDAAIFHMFSSRFDVVGNELPVYMKEMEIYAELDVYLNELNRCSLKYCLQSEELLPPSVIDELVFSEFGLGSWKGDYLNNDSLLVLYDHDDQFSGILAIHNPINNRSSQGLSWPDFPLKLPKLDTLAMVRTSVNTFYKNEVAQSTELIFKSKRAADYFLYRYDQHWRGKEMGESISLDRLIEMEKEANKKSRFTMPNRGWLKRVLKS